MGKWTKLLLLAGLILVPFFYFRSLNCGTSDKDLSSFTGGIDRSKTAFSSGEKARIALIFDDLGQSLQDIKDVYSLKIPLTVAVIPGLKFSRNISHIAERCDFSVLLHLPMEPHNQTPAFVKARRNFITGSLTDREIRALLRKYLASLRVAVGVNNHMGSKATENPRIMKAVLSVLKEKRKFFIDSHTTDHSCSSSIAGGLGVTCAENSAFLDAVDDPAAIKDKIYHCLDLAEKQGKVIIIAHPKANTFKVLAEELPALRGKVDFITVEEYFGL